MQCIVISPISIKQSNPTSNIQALQNKITRCNFSFSFIDYVSRTGLHSEMSQMSQISKLYPGHYKQMNNDNKCRICFFFIFSPWTMMLSEQLYIQKPLRYFLFLSVFIFFKHPKTI